MKRVRSKLHRMSVDTPSLRNAEPLQWRRAKVETLNRSAVVIRPKQPFLDWLHAVDPTSYGVSALDLQREPTIYLIPECGTEAELAEALTEFCKKIFDEQLEAWYTDISTWPEDRSFSVFSHWFDFQYHSVLIDLCDQPLREH